MNDPRTDEPEDNPPPGDRVGIVFGHAWPNEPHREGRAEKDPDRGEDAMPRERYRAQVHAGVKGQLDQQLTVRGTS